jgi:hypothetical protein
MKTSFSLALFAATFLATTGALAGDPTACLDAASKGQKLQRAHHLVEAREQLRICAAAACPAVVQSDCANWLDAVEKALPSVVVSAKSGAGVDLFDVKVTMDGQPFAPKLDGRAIPVDPGPHVFHFEAADGKTIDQRLLVKEGVASQAVTVVIGPPPAQPAATPAQPEKAETKKTASPLRTIGWVTGAVGVVGLGVGAAFGLIAMGDKSDANCNAANQCLSDPLASARSAALISDIGFIAGGVLVATGATLVILGNKKTEHPPATATLLPMVGTNGGGFSLAGSF